MQINFKMGNQTGFSSAIFDMDGVIVDNDKYHLLAWKEFCKIKGFAYSEANFRKKYFGLSNHDILCGITGMKLSQHETTEMGEAKEKIYRNIYSKEIKPIDGLLEFLTTLKQNGKKIALASSAPTSNVDFVLDSLNIRSFFDAVVDAQMVLRAKPSPEIYLKAASLLNENPSKCVVFEDSHAGIKSAQDAGMKVVALATTNSRDDLPNLPLIIDDYVSLNISDLDF